MLRMQNPQRVFLREAVKSPDEICRPVKTSAYEKANRAVGLA